jgi:hypothetical protein
MGRTSTLNEVSEFLQANLKEPEKASLLERLENLEGPARPAN